MKIREAGEMYLETILTLTRASQTVRMVDVAAAMGYSKPTVSIYLRELKENGYIDIDPEGHISLTAHGMEIADRIYSRHTAITAFLISLGVDPETAATDACKMEHDISDTTLECMQAHYLKQKHDR